MSETLSFRVPAMHCENCERAIRGEVARVAGVEAVDVDLDAKLVTVRESVSDQAVREAIDEAGYDVAS
jgi:copper chaperone